MVKKRSPTSLNVKDPEARRRRGDNERLHAKLAAIARRAAAHAKGPYIDHADLLYDEHGLPK